MVFPVAVLATIALAGSAQAVVTNFYWTDRDSATLNKTTAAGVTTQLVAPAGGRLQDVDLGAGNTLYFSDWGPVGPPGGGGKINSVSTSGGSVTNILTTSDGVHQLALDEPRIYYTQGVSYDTRHIGFVETSGANHTILQNEASWFPSGIAVDAVNGKIYWGDIGVISGFPFHGAVNVMNTDGTSGAELSPHLDGRGRGFALYSGDIYLTAHDPLSPSFNGEILRYNIASGTLTSLIADTNGFWDIQIDEADQRMYWTNYGAGAIESAKLDGTDRRIEQSGLSSPYGLALEFGPTNHPPDCSGARPAEGQLWPPNHRYRAISILGVTDPDSGDVVTITVTGITQDEPLNTRGDGNTCPDGQIVGGQAAVRAERTGSPGIPGNGRVYVISFTASDGQGGECQGSVSVCVPHDRGIGSTCINDGQSYNSLGPCTAEAPVGQEITEVGLTVGTVTGSQAMVEFSLPNDTQVEVSVFDVAGRRLATVENGPLAAGVYQRAWDMSGATKGLYFVRLRAGGVTLTKTVVKIQ